MPLAMLIFMDESGDTGFKFHLSSSRYFVLTMVIFDSLEAAGKANEAVKEVRKELKRSESLEFKFSTGTNDEAKRVFFRRLSKHDFRYRSVVIDKSLLTKREPHNPEESLYMLITDQLFLRAQGHIKNAAVFIDRTAKSKTFIQEFNHYLRKKLNTDMNKLIGDIRHKDSRSNNLLQLADMVCGAIYRKYNRKDESFYKMIKKREEDLWKPY
ncbi:DUF3800 domain-containing protein [Patescibacteria group bacterium]|nr:DUF3800 domain-containing protein [Patescibacteria group bacterium]